MIHYRAFALLISLIMTGLLFIVLLLGGCVTLMQPRSAQQQVLVPEDSNAAHFRATKAVMAMGASISYHDASRRTISAKINKAVTLGITLTPQPQGTLLDVRATAEPGYVLAHDVPEDVQAFLTAYHEN